MIKLLRTDRKLSKNKYVCLFLVQAKNLYSETEDLFLKVNHPEVIVKVMGKLRFSKVRTQRKITSPRNHL